MNEQDTQIIAGKHGRDAGKRFMLTRLDPVSAARFMLRLVSSLRVPSYEDLLDSLREADASGAAAPIDQIMQILQGCDPDRVHALIQDAISTMQVAPDPQHPEAFRPLTADDMAELRTLGDLLMAYVKFSFGA